MPWCWQTFAAEAALRVIVCGPGLVLSDSVLLVTTMMRVTWADDMVGAKQRW